MKEKYKEKWNPSKIFTIFIFKIRLNAVRSQDLGSGGAQFQMKRDI